MHTVTPFRGPEPPVPGSVLCPYCEVVYQGGANGERCELCGTPLVTLGARGRRGAGPALSGLGRGIVLGMARTAQSRWGAALWVGLYATTMALLLQWGAVTLADAFGARGVREALNGRTSLLGLALLAPLHLLGGLMIGLLLRYARYVCAALAGAVVALPPLDVVRDDPLVLLPQVGSVLLWLAGAWLGGRRG